MSESPHQNPPSNSEASSNPPSAASTAASERFNPTCLLRPSTKSSSSSNTTALVPLISHPTPFGLPTFVEILDSLVLHPERTSSLILRADILPTPPSSPSPTSTSSLSSSKIPTPYRTVHRRLLPRQPHRDAALLQRCTFHRSPSSSPPSERVVLTPLLEPGQTEVPHYHPAVNTLHFTWTPEEIGIAIEPLEGEEEIAEQSRVYRTALVLLQTVWKHGLGLEKGYKKRVNHDILVPRDDFQDLYLTLKERYRHLIPLWVESTNPSKHVWEDVSIASYLILLWRSTYPPSTAPPPAVQDSARPWTSYPRAPGGFVDLGCGNGLLTHILHSEGYAGYGFDLRARKSWSALFPSTPLKAEAFDPAHLLREEAWLLRDCFVIANHADELTPWAPLLCALTPGAAYLSIPCCLHTLTGRFTASSPPGGGGRYAAYLDWLARLSGDVGIEAEREALRIPSTRNWALVGRRRAEGAEGQRRAREMVREVLDGGAWKARKEGVGRDH